MDSGCNFCALCPYPPFTKLRILLQDLPQWVQVLLYGVPLSNAPVPVADEDTEVRHLMQQSGDLGAMQTLVDATSPAAPTLPALLAGADWACLHQVLTACPRNRPWLALPLLMAPSIISGGAKIYLHAGRG